MVWAGSWDVGRVSGAPVEEGEWRKGGGRGGVSGPLHLGACAQREGVCRKGCGNEI